MPRTATVRAIAPTDVLCMGRGEFAAVAKNFTLLRASFEQTLKDRAAPPTAPRIPAAGGPGS